MGEKPLDPRSLANYILAIRDHFGFQTTNLELQKIAFFCYAKYLKTYNVKLCDGFFEAWDHGPVHPLIYREFKRFGANPILDQAISTNLITGEKKVVAPPSDNKRRTHIVETVLQLRGLTASQLRAKSHARGSAWHKVRKNGQINLASQVIIPDDVIREEFSRHMLSMADIPDESEEDSALEDKPPEFNRSR